MLEKRAKKVFLIFFMIFYILFSVVMLMIGEILYGLGLRNREDDIHKAILFHEEEANEIHDKEKI